MSVNRRHWLMFLLFFVSDDTVLFGTNINPVFMVIRYLVYISLFLYLGFSTSTFHLQNAGRSRVLVFILVIVMSFAFTMLTHLDFRNGYFLEGIVMLLAVQLARHIDLRYFFSDYVKVLFFLAIISLVVFPISILFRPILDFFPITTNYAGVEFINLFFSVVFSDASIVRNTSIFREPGIFAIYLVIGIAIELYFNPKANFRNLVVFILALMTTFSTAGILIVAFLGIGYFFKSRDIKSTAGWFLAVLAVVVVAMFNPEIFESVFSKFDDTSVDYASTLARISSVSVPFMIFIHNPFFGAGLTQFVDQYLVFSEQLFGIAISSEGWSTNTLMNFFAIYGFPLGALMMYGVFKFSCIFSPRKIARLFISISLLMIFSSQELRFSLLFCTFIMYGLFHQARVSRSEDSR